MPGMTRQLLILIALACLLPAKAQISSVGADSTLRISLLTAAPGAEVYQLEGHSGLRMQYDGRDFTANWGLFDFSAPNFIYRFVKGETDYKIGVWPTEYFLEEYRSEGRSVTEQVLNLTPAQCRRVIDLVEENMRPENRVYRYNYVLDNCATRPVAIIEKACGDSIHFPVAAAGLEEKATFRNVMRRFHADYPWYQFGIDLALGPGIDAPISVRQTGFAPVILSEIAANATIGDSIPLVKSTDMLVRGNPEGVVLPPTPWYLTPDTAMWALVIICLMLRIRCNRHPVAAKLSTAVYFAITGIEGCVIAFLVFVSSHEATTPNWLILWINPLCFIVPALEWWKKATPVVQLYLKWNMAMIVLYGITIAFGDESPNSAFLPLALSNIIMSLTCMKSLFKNIR